MLPEVRDKMYSSHDIVFFSFFLFVSLFFEDKRRRRRRRHPVLSQSDSRSVRPFIRSQKKASF
jgi:hypothetical protein